MNVEIEGVDSMCIAYLRADSGNGDGVSDRRKSRSG